jgi:hypothetical protein
MAIDLALRVERRNPPIQKIVEPSCAYRDMRE